MMTAMILYSSFLMELLNKDAELLCKNHEAKNKIAKTLIFVFSYYFEKILLVFSSFLLNFTCYLQIYRLPS